MKSSASSSSGMRRGKKIFYILDGLRPEERQELLLWLGSPLHANSPQFVAMLQVILDAMAAAAEPELSPDLFAEILSPDRVMDDVKAGYVWVRVTQLQDAILDYMAWTRFRSDSAAQYRYRLLEVSDRNLERLIKGAYQAGIKALPATESAATLSGRLQLEKPYSHYLAGMGFRKGGKHLDEIHTALDGHFVLQKVKFACAGVLEGEPSADPKQSPLLQAALDFIWEQGAGLPKVVRAYACAYWMLQTFSTGEGDAQQHFRAFEELFQQPADFAPDEAMDLFVHAQNYCVLRYRQGDGAMLDALVRLYESVLQSGMALENGFIQRGFFKNTVELMCRLGRWTWAEQFVEQYQKRVIHDVEGLSGLYAMALVRFYAGDYRSVVRQLYSDVTKLDGLDTGAGARLLLCQALWELAEYEWLISALTGFKQYLRRHEEIESSQRKRFLLFVKYMDDACKAMTGRPDLRRKRLQQVLAAIEAQEAPNAQAWLRKALATALG